jgi:hypothetical protein
LPIPKPSSSIARIASGCTNPAGREPADSGSTRSPWSMRASASDIWLRAALPVHRNMIRLRSVATPPYTPARALGFETPSGEARERHPRRKERRGPQASRDAPERRRPQKRRFRSRFALSVR